jgi:hypothetical protein
MYKFPKLQKKCPNGEKNVDSSCERIDISLPLYFKNLVISTGNGQNRGGMMLFIHVSKGHQFLIFSPGYSGILPMNVVFFFYAFRWLLRTPYSDWNILSKRLTNTTLPKRRRFLFRYPRPPNVGQINMVERSHDHGCLDQYG